MTKSLQVLFKDFRFKGTRFGRREILKVSDFGPYGDDENEADANDSVLCIFRSTQKRMQWKAVVTNDDFAPSLTKQICFSRAFFQVPGKGNTRFVFAQLETLSRFLNAK